jgi:hypothetical protein
MVCGEVKLNYLLFVAKNYINVVMISTYIGPQPYTTNQTQTRWLGLREIGCGYWNNLRMGESKIIAAV